MPSGQRRRFAIAWLIIIAACVLPCTDTVNNRLRSEQDLVEKNRKIVGDLFGDSSNEHFNRDSHEKSVVGKGRSATRDLLRKEAINVKRRKKKSLLTIPGPKLFQDRDSIFDSDSSKSHKRIKRIMKSSDRKELLPLFVDRSHPSHRMYKRYSLVEENPADENEAEYANAFEDNDVDVPDAFLNDEITKKRNNLEDVYPEAGNQLQVKQSPSVSRSKLDSVRKKRYRDEVAAKNAEVDCEGGEYYDDDDVAENLSVQKEQKVESVGFDIVREDVKQKLDGEAPAAISDKVENSEIDESSRNANLGADMDALFPKNEERRSAAATKKHSDRSKTKPKKKPTSKPKKSHKKPKSSASIANRSVKSNLQLQKAKKHQQAEKTRKKPGGKSAVVMDNEADKCCGNNNDEVEEEEAASSRDKRKNFVVKLIPREGNAKEVQIYEKGKMSSLQKARLVDANNNNAASGEVSLMTGKGDAIMGEVKNLLGKLVQKFDDLHGLISEIRDARIDKATKLATQD